MSWELINCENNFRIRKNENTLELNYQSNVRHYNQWKKTKELNNKTKLDLIKTKAMKSMLDLINNESEVKVNIQLKNTRFNKQ